ncbi:GIY-YIG nuclease family protein [Paraburkholderia silviterrae]|uniref:GIY-YIG nuclease family protein n=1 Tax=Paraburkholderia silviterrae TaxID=2528715 RepID=A0A4R5MFS3_9BURK|nr:GIY-YIG nuclease family protein [Paraburkholderia silviterrae]TDG25887.1 GIY-YIG nuclease family protein [Paraburkholderia silviterrae]
MSYGFVYVLGNDAMPGIYKIGMTDRAPRERMDELSKATAVPLPFDLVMYAQVSDPREVEAGIHGDLAKYRVNSSREFFRAPLEEIGDTIRAYAHDVCHVEYAVYMWHAEADAKRDFLLSHFHSQNHDPIFWPPQCRGFEE